MLYRSTYREFPPQSLAESLPALVQRLDHRAVAQVTAALQAQHVDRDEFVDELDAPYGGLQRQDLLRRKLLRIVASEAEKLRAERESHQRFSDRFFGLLPGRPRQELLISKLAEDGSRISVWLDRRAVRQGLLDFDAYQERITARNAARIACIRVALLALESIVVDVVERLDGDDLRQVAERFASDDQALFELAQQHDDPSLAWLAFRAAAPLVRALLGFPTARVPSRWLTHAARTAVSPRANVWAQRTALEVLAADSTSAVEFLRGRLSREVLDRDDWFVRARAAELLVEVAPGVAVEHLRHHLATETSDAVPIRVCRSLAGSPEDGVVELLEELGRATSPRVRFAALEALAGTCTAETEERPRAARALAEALVAEPNASVLEAIRHTVVDVFDDARERQAPVAEAVVAARELLAARMREEHDAHVSSQLADLRIDLAAVALDPAVWELCERFDALGRGDSIHVGLDYEPGELRRALARSARSGYGLYARAVSSGGWRVTRGARQRTRLWRSMHEVRHPAPNKRQGFHHARGRVFAGPLRAHPTHLGELTPTTVPGEKRHVQAEGGWGPYVPLVEDLLDAQFSSRPIELVTTLGTTLVRAPSSRWKRWRNALEMSLRFRWLDDQRLAAVRGSDEQQRSRYLAVVREKYGVTVQFRPHFRDDPSPASVATVVARSHDEPLLLGTEDRPRLPAASGVAVVGASIVQELSRSVGNLVEATSRAATELFQRGGVGIRGLAVVMVFLLTTFLLRLLWVRISFVRWRSDIPLCIGGWGTRGKSGTERLKAGLFGGMGYEVFVKTTGCEAMFIHSVREMEPLEIFIYRPYDKASIWEQRDMLALARKLGTDVFLWECMALNPRYVSILQEHWMRDDLVTLTNAYPDHEDIQGPSGVDVAETIAEFIPRRGHAITSEREMLPIFERVAGERHTKLQVVELAEEMRLSDDILNRFPYREHPRNIALVSRMATELGVDRDFALFAMADHVVPDLGVLKEYPSVTVLGRSVRFVNGCSANERAGFMNNWQRMELEDVGANPGSRSQVVTIVNNRGDRVSRSAVFADILVNDVTVDRHVLIGTNLSGLRSYLDESLDRYLATLTLVEPGETVDVANARLDAFLSRVRIRQMSAQTLCDHLVQMAEACSIAIDRPDPAPLEGALDEVAVASTDWRDAVRRLGEHPVVREYLAEVEGAAATARDLAPEQSESAALMHDLLIGDASEVARFFVERAACAATHRMARQQIRQTLEHDSGYDELHERMRELWRQRFLSTVVSIEDSETPGDGIIVQAARVVPPGSDTVLMGVQNIKGTGLDFVYRWVDLDTTTKRLEALATASDGHFRSELTWLRGTHTLHLTEALAAWRVLDGLPNQRRCSPRELALIERAEMNMAELAVERFEAVASAAEAPGARRLRTRFVAALERILDPFDAVWRRYRSERLMRMLANQRVSHYRMAAEMRDLTKRQKGGWLVKRLARR